LKVKNILLLSLAFVATAVVLTVIQPPFGADWLAWVAWVPFVLVCSPTVKFRQLALIAYFVSLCYWLGNLYWVAPVTIIGWVAFCLYTALLWPVLAFGLRYCRLRKIPLVLAVPVLIVGAERLQGLFLGGFLWRHLSHSQYANITLIQIADIFGAAGVSFLIAMVNGLVAELILDARYSMLDARCWKSVFKISNLLKIGLVCAVLAAAVVYGRWRVEQSEEVVKAGPLVGSLQSNVPQSVKRSFQQSDRIFAELMGKSRAAAAAGAELVIWPETMVQATMEPAVLGLLDASHSYRVFDRALSEHAKDTAFVLVGAYGGRPEIKEDMTIHLPKRYNSAFLYGSDGRRSDKQYHKIHLVPFGEVVPFRKRLPVLFNLLMKFTPYNYDYSLDAGSEYTVFDMTSGRGLQERTYRFSVMICYEDTVPAIARRFTLDDAGRKRLDWLVNISNDGWFVRFKNGNVFASTELVQHTAVCVFRAVENRLSVVRSVNTGISCLIDSVGRVRDGFTAGDLPSQAMARRAVAGWFVDRVPIDERTTFFSRYGQWLDFCCAIGFVLAIIVPLWESRLSRDQRNAK